MYRPLQFQKRSQHFIGVHNETLSVVAMRVCNPDWLPVGINRCDAAPPPPGFAEIVRDDFPIPFHSLHRAVSTTAKYVNFVIDLRLRFSLRFI